MPEIFLLQGVAPPFPLAAWILREEGFSVRVAANAEEMSPELAADSPRLCVINTGRPLEEEQHSARLIRSWAGATPILHIASAPNHDAEDCGCDYCMRPPHTATALLDAVSRLLQAA